MPLFDMPLEELRAYKPPRAEPEDFDNFWDATLQEARAQELDAVFERADMGLRTVDVYDVSFSGFNGDRIKGWYMRPRGSSDPLPGVVEYIGYGGGRGYPLEWLAFPSAGFAYLVMDTRGQGSVWRRGDTPDMGSGANPSTPGFMTQGILDPQTYYYRRLYTDAVRAVEAIRTRADVDGERIAVTGSSQGGGMSIAAAGLLPDVQACLTDVPFLQHFRRALDITPKDPYPEIARFLQIHRDKIEAVFRTLSYFDGMNFAARMRARALFSVGLMDTICPPSTVYASYNHVTSEKAIMEYYFNDHEGGGAHHMLEKIRYLRKLWRE
ncbi:MAG: acetylxylan esterase [Chloroflexota bacterium]|nr:acetylxylan esterase [Chloroflexota bacterium]MDE2854457.1 acetylxylan esterase [Chloroflexota bacterium]MDE2946731.1 acetylxylan esterase [Chloroflexota bacterium]